LGAAGCGEDASRPAQAAGQPVKTRGISGYRRASSSTTHSEVALYDASGDVAGVLAIDVAQDHAEHSLHLGQAARIMLASSVDAPDANGNRRVGQSIQAGDRALEVAILLDPQDVPLTVQLRAGADELVLYDRGQIAPSAALADWLARSDLGTDPDLDLLEAIERDDAYYRTAAVGGDGNGASPSDSCRPLIERFQSLVTPARGWGGATWGTLGVASCGACFGTLAVSFAASGPEAPLSTGMARTACGSCGVWFSVGPQAIAGCARQYLGSLTP
jgi:hypothetical protein